MIKTKEWLIESRQKAGLTQQQLADRSGISVAAIRNIEQGNRVGNNETWLSLINGLGIKKYTIEEVLNNLKYDVIDFVNGDTFIKGLYFGDFIVNPIFTSIEKKFSNFLLYTDFDSSCVFIKTDDENYRTIETPYIHIQKHCVYNKKRNDI